MREYVGKYNGLLIYEGAKGDKPKAGAFYQPKKGDTLSWIGSKSGIPWRKINLHPWNINNLVEYRKSSSNCSSKKLTGAERLEGFISLCPSIGFFQTIWIPPANGMGPDEIMAQKSGLKPEDTKPQSYVDVPEKDPLNIKTTMLNTGLKTQQLVPLLVVDQPKADGVPWWLIGGLTLVTIGMFVYVSK